MSFVWSPELATGNVLIDTQHKQLFATANALFTACQIGEERQEVAKTMDFLVKYIIKHFADEEALQQQYGYPEYAAHREAHVHFTGLVNDLIAKVSREGPTDDVVSEVYITIGEWLLSHLKNEDRRMAAYIQGKAQTV
jgi:hemerythrin